ncbi:Uncharacterised protein [Vibrio cholerae]|nr:Uncharacterised protein [Vibrio cholerae]
MACSTFATMLRCVRMAPFATPVVPPVYCRKAMSSPDINGFTYCRRRPLCSALRIEIAPGRSYLGTMPLTYFTTKSTIVPLARGSICPRLVSTTCLTCVLATICSKVLAKFETITIARASASFS